MPWLLLLPAAVVAWFLLLVALGTAIGRKTPAAPDRHMIRHIAKTYPLQDGNPEP